MAPIVTPQYQHDTLTLNRGWTWMIMLMSFLIASTSSAQNPTLKAERFGGDQFILSWDDSKPFVVEVAPSANGPWFTTWASKATQSPFICNLRTGPEIDFEFSENPFEEGVYLFRLKNASVFDVQPESGFVGQLEDKDAFVALIVANEESVAYVCNGDVGVSEWFRGETPDPNQIELTNPSGSQFRATFSQESFSGEVKFSTGETHAFSLTPNHAENAGIYRVIDEKATEREIEAGWIINDADDERGAFKIRSTFSKAVRIREIKDGTSNTINLGETTRGLKAKVFRFSTRRSLGRRFSISRRSPTETPPTLKPPAVVDVWIRGTAWTSSFLNHLGPKHAVSLMNAGKPLPWVNLNRIDVVFDQGVNVHMNALRLAGVNELIYSFAKFTYNRATFTGTWILNSPIQSDKLLLEIAGEAGDPNPIRSATNGQLLGSDVTLNFSVLPGDVTQDGTVGSDDAAIAMNQIGTQPGSVDYSKFSDLDGNAGIFANDAAQILSRLFLTLPDGTPTF